MARDYGMDECERRGRVGVEEKMSQRNDEGKEGG